MKRKCLVCEKTIGGDDGIGPQLCVKHFNCCPACGTTAGDFSVEYDDNCRCTECGEVFSDREVELAALKLAKKSVARKTCPKCGGKGWV